MPTIAPRQAVPMAHYDYPPDFLMYTYKVCSPVRCMGLLCSAPSACQRHPCARMQGLAPPAHAAASWWPHAVHARHAARQVEMCARTENHDWARCPYAHQKEKARRRDPRQYKYASLPCPDTMQVRAARMRPGRMRTRPSLLAGSKRPAASVRLPAHKRSTRRRGTAGRHVPARRRVLLHAQRAGVLVRWAGHRFAAFLGLLGRVLRGRVQGTGGRPIATATQLHAQPTLTKLAPCTRRLHPARFKTQLCKNGAACTRPLCFFAHR